MQTKTPKFVRTSSGVVNSFTGEILTSPRQQELNKYQFVKPEFSRGPKASAMTVRPVDTSSKPRQSGRDIARRKATGDVFAENIEDRPTGRARETYALKYVLAERLRKHNADMIKKGRPNEVLPTSGKEYNKNMRRMILDFKSRFPGIPLDEADIMHVNPKGRGGKNVWSNLRIGPRKLNLDQGTAHPSAFRMLPADEARRFGSLGYGTGSTWEGLPSEQERVPRTQINPSSGLRRPIGPTKALPGVANLLLEPLALAGIAGVREDITLSDVLEYLKSKYSLQGPPSGPPAMG
jgi:hypothetical protein